MLLFFVFFVILLVESFMVIPVSMFIFMDVSFLMLVSTAGAGAIPGVEVEVVAVESVVVLAVSFVLHAATASNAATTTRRFIYDLLEVGAILLVHPG